MTAPDVVNSRTFQKCLDFHGHLCPGLSLGYQACRAGLEALRSGPSEDEELVAVVESNACSADAVQVMTGCTFGKGNLVFRDYGKIVFTFLSRQTGRGVRVSLRPEVFPADEEHLALLRKVQTGAATAEEQERFADRHRERSHELLARSPEELFTISPAVCDPPEKARVDPSLPCQCCGEPTMKSKLIESAEGLICLACREENQA
ncbi:MAG: FmdE family protein [Desulfosudaceae bacterium]